MSAKGVTEHLARHKVAKRVLFNSGLTRNFVSLCGRLCVDYSN